MHTRKMVWKFGCHSDIAQIYGCVTLLLLSFISLGIQSELNHGEQCGEDILRQCNQSKLLVCSSFSICECTIYQTYVAEKEKCVHEIGNYCSKWPEVDCPQHASCVEEDTKSGIQLPKQVIRAFSARDDTYGGFKCKCNVGYIAVLTKCNPVLLFGNNCTIPKYGPDLCDLGRNLLCSHVTDTCSCIRKDMVYDDGLKACVVPLGSKCSDDMDYPDQCLQNGMCSDLLKPKNSTYNIDRLWNDGQPYKTDEGVCVCLPGYSANSFGKCVGSYNAQCSVTDPCNSERFLKCVNGVCRCAQGRNMEYRLGINSKCMLLPGSTCSPDVRANGTTPSCIPECECKYGKCKIRNTKTWKNRFGVKLSHAQNCTVDDSVGKRICDASAGLACIGDKSCDCFDASLNWRMASKRCVAKIGEACGHFSPSEDIQHITFHVLFISEHSLLPSPNEPFYVSCDKGLSCIYQPSKLTSVCMRLK